MSRIWIGLTVVMATAASTLCAQQPGAPAAPRPEAGTAPAVSSSGRAPTLGGPAGSSAAASRPGTLPRGKAAAGSETLTVLKAGTPEHARVICRLNHVPAFSMAQTINQLLRGEGQLPPSGERAEKAATARSVVLVPESIGNRLLIAGPPDAVEEVRRLIEELDQPPGMLVLEVVLGEAPVSQEKPAGSRKSERKPSSAGPAAQVRVVERPPQMETIGRGRLTTMDNQPAQIQIGTRVPGFRGASAPSSPGQAGQMSLENVGLTLAVTPRIIPGAVVMEIDVTQSQLGPENESVTVGIAGNQLVRSAKIDTTMAQTTVRIRDGESMVLGSIARAGKPDKELLIVVTPHIVEVGGAKQ